MKEKEQKFVAKIALVGIARLLAELIDDGNPRGENDGNVYKKQ